jgi:putative flippase GtrA
MWMLAGKSLPEVLRFLRFCVVGVVNTAAGYGFFALFIFLAIPYMIAGTLSFICGICFNYVVTRRFVFEGQGRKNAFSYYLVSYGILYFYSLALLWVLIDGFGLTAYLAGLVSLPINAVVSFLLLRAIVFTRRVRGVEG